ncbi:Ig-like domain-containing protein [Aeoliella sp. ICT_H6.2]|uniref:Ig-like domain-containing protein n=1 Tax=Aeoliella straminimaris TaxID=2954799 RepID=A0A9X2FHD5_9BACT|nr:Ig-like domain-containing protein [Aeoliella straminimaris]MCO6044761.1 Ig-like domain-containing protein [Aeoliella straminimaris]
MKETYWNLRSTQILPFDPTSSGIRQGIPLIPDEKRTIIVGWWLEWPESEEEKRNEDGPWYEYIGNYDDIRPRNIYLAQLKRRLGVDNLPPDVEITSPITGSMMTAPTVDIRAMIDDRDGADARVVVQLLVNGEPSPGVATRAPYGWTVPLQAGTRYEITVRARDNAGEVTSDAVTFTTSDELTEGGETILNLG